MAHWRSHGAFGSRRPCESSKCLKDQSFGLRPSGGARFGVLLLLSQKPPTKVECLLTCFWAPSRAQAPRLPRETSSSNEKKASDGLGLGALTQGVVPLNDCAAQVREKWLASESSRIVQALREHETKDFQQCFLRRFDACPHASQSVTVAGEGMMTPQSKALYIDSGRFLLLGSRLQSFADTSLWQTTACGFLSFRSSVGGHSALHPICPTSCRGAGSNGNPFGAHAHVCFVRGI